MQLDIQTIQCDNTKLNMKMQIQIYNKKINIIQ